MDISAHIWRWQIDDNQWSPSRVLLFDAAGGEKSRLAELLDNKAN